jgi:hypothetical protein
MRSTRRPGQYLCKDLDLPMKHFLLLSAALLTLSACDGSPTGDDTRVVAVQVMPDDRTLAVGETLTLDLVVRDEDGGSSGAGAVRWTSDQPGVATVSVLGVVTAVGTGTATIRGEVEGVSGSVRVTVAPAPPGCGTAGSLRSLPVGGSVVLGGIAASTVCLDGGAAGAEYVAVPFHAGNPDAAAATVRLETRDVVPVAGASPLLSPAPSLAGGRQPDDDWHQRMRERAARELAPFVDDAITAGGRGGPRPSYVLNLAAPTVGQQVQVNTGVSSCDDPRLRTGRVVAVGQRSIVLADEANPSGGLTDAEYASFAAAYDTLVHPAVTAAFGEAGDVDGNGRVVIFFTRAVNELTEAGSGEYVGGYFHSRDLFPTRARDGLTACAGSNYAEMFYLLVPDPIGVVGGNAFPRELVLRTTLGTLAHELQHLINTSRRLYQVRTPQWQEETWLDEGLSHVAEEVTFYRASGLSPRQNLDGPRIVANPRAAEAFSAYMDQNGRRLARYLADPEHRSPYDPPQPGVSDLATRGAAWAFLRYAADRRGGSEAELWRALVDGGRTGIANLQAALGVDPRLWARDWTVSMFTDDVVPGIEPRFTQPSWQFRTLYTTLPLLTRRLAGPGTEEVVIEPGSGAFVRFGVLPATVATLTARTPEAQPLPSSIYLTIVRTR